MIAVVPVRAGTLPAGGAETVALAAGRAILVGEAAPDAVAELGAVASEIRTWDTPGFAPGHWAAVLSGALAGEPRVVLPASPDGRDLAPRLAVILGHHLFSGVVELREDLVRTIGFDGAAMIEHHLSGPAVMTLQPGVRGIDPTHDHHEAPPVVTAVLPDPASPGDTVATPPERGAGAGSEAGTKSDARTTSDARTVEVLPPDASTMDLAESPRILAGGNGLEDPVDFERLAEVAAELDASVGTTRVITDKGWLPHERQIGTTGVVVDPRLYVAFGISGAVQHTNGLGQPDHVISVNTDPHCPMMSLADLAVVADAGATIEHLVELLRTAADDATPTSDATPTGDATPGER